MWLLGKDQCLYANLYPSARAYNRGVQTKSNCRQRPSPVSSRVHLDIEWTSCNAATRYSSFQHSRRLCIAVSQRTRSFQVVRLVQTLLQHAQAARKFPRPVRCGIPILLSPDCSRMTHRACSTYDATDGENAPLLTHMQISGKIGS